MTSSQKQSNYSLCETVADIAIRFAHAPWVPEDSRELTRLIIEWAEIFEAHNKDREWNGEYLEAIDAFFDDQFYDWNESKDVNREPIRANPLIK